MEKKDIDVEQLKDLYENQDVTLDYIASELGCSRSLIKTKVKHLGLKKFSKFSFITKELLEDLYIKQDLSMQQIATKLGTNKRNIQRKVEEYKLCKGWGEKYNISKEVIKNLLKEGLSANKIAKILGCSQSVILKRIKKYNINHNRRKYNINEQELRKLYIEDKLSIRKIAKLYNCSDIIIRIRLKEMGLRDENGKARIILDEELLRRYIKEGLSYQEVANKMNLPKNTIANKCRKLGIKQPKSKIRQATYEELYKLYIEEGKTEYEIAQIYECSRGSAGRALNKLGIRREDKKDIQEKQLSKILSDKKLKDLYLDKGLSARRIHNDLGVPEKYILSRLNKLGIRKISQWDFITEDVLRNLYVQQNMNIPEITKLFKCPKSVIASKVYRYNLTAERTLENHTKSIHRSYQNSTTRSQGEVELCEMYPTDFINYHDVIGWELDLWYPESRLAIEYNGEYWHSSATSKPGKHIAKTSICDNGGIYLINIFERHWKDKEQKLKILNIIDNVLKPNELLQPLGVIQEVSKEEAYKFINENNVDKVVSADYHIGTYNSKGLLVNLLSFKESQFNIKVIRFTTRLGYREDYRDLLEYIKEEYDPATIEVTCNRLYYNGDLFKKLGFKFIDNIKAEYCYVWGDKVISRTTYNKNPDKYKKYYKVYDCGRVKLRLDL